ncbi:MAG: sn-glycerol-3-phosphate ABC transporter permease UgpA [Spirochaetes bacterium]|nr:sn-glycerol-3-phosphate ABC transporter permease UgpA [Spirochaetota bacterium]
MADQRAVFDNKLLPYLLVLPQMVIVGLFFLWPGFQALVLSLFREDAFGTRREFVGLENFARLFASDAYLNSMQVTFLFSFWVMVIAISVALYLAVLADRAVKGSQAYTTLLIWPYAVAPAVSGVMWMFLFNPTVGVISYGLDFLGYDWNHALRRTQGFLLVTIAASWRQIAYNFLFFLAGLQSIPPSLIESAAIDGAKPRSRFWRIVFPLLSPTTFFLVIMNIMYSFFLTFGIIHQVTQGGPNQATNILVYKVYRDGFVNLNLGSSSAQSVVLMAIVIGLTFIQFRFFERKVHY